MTHLFVYFQFPPTISLGWIKRRGMVALTACLKSIMYGGYTGGADASAIYGDTKIHIDSTKDGASIQALITFGDLWTPPMIDKVKRFLQNNPKVSGCYLTEAQTCETMTP